MLNCLARTSVVLALCFCSFAAIADPPGRVGRVAQIEGEVVLVPAAGEPAFASPVNFPLVSGAVLRAGRDGRAEVQVGGVTLWLAGDTDLELTQVDDEALRFTLHGGTLAARTGDPGDGKPPQIAAAGAAIELIRAGRYRIDADNTAATLSVRDGLARVVAGGEISYVTAGRIVRASAAGLLSPPTAAGASPEQMDAFDRWLLAEERERLPAAVAPRYVSSEMTGWQDLDRYGRWQRSDEFGTLWIPDWVPAGWAPYRSGQWVWLNPWGWTWIDQAPWGFAPFHFGRWTLHRDRWAWVPGDFVRRPVFAPALVSFITGGTVVVSPGRHRPRSWVPLAPREGYLPAFRASTGFVGRINAAHSRWHRPGGEASSRREFGADAVTVGGAELTVRPWRGRHDSAPAATVADPGSRHRREFGRLPERAPGAPERRTVVPATVPPPAVPATQSAVPAMSAVPRTRPEPASAGPNSATAGSALPKESRGERRLSAAHREGRESQRPPATAVEREQRWLERRHETRREPPPAATDEARQARRERRLNADGQPARPLPNPGGDRR